MTQAITKTLNTFDQMLSAKTEAPKIAGNKSLGTDKMVQDFKSVFDKKIDQTSENSPKDSIKTISDLKNESNISNNSKNNTDNQIKADIKTDKINNIENCTENCTENNIEKSAEICTESSSITAECDWTKFRDMLTQISEEANVETSLDLTLARDVNEIITQLKEAVENAVESIKKASEEDAEETEDIEDIAGALLSVLNNNQNNNSDLETSTEDADSEILNSKVPFEQVLTFIDKSLNTETISTKDFNNETKTLDFEKVELTQDEIVELTENTSEEITADKSIKENLNSELESLLDEDVLRDLNIESIESEANSSHNGTLMQHQTPEEHSVRIMINEEIDAFDLKLEMANNSQPIQNTNPKTVDVNPSRIIDQITKHLETLQNNSKVNIVLNPESLGKVNIQLLSTKEGLAAQFTVTTQEARDLLMKGLDGLKEALTSHGVGVDNVSVKVADSQKTEYKQDWTEQEGSRGGNKEQGHPNREEKEKGLFEKMMAQTTNKENGNV